MYKSIVSRVFYNEFIEIIKNSLNKRTFWFNNLLLFIINYLLLLVINYLLFIIIALIIFFYLFRNLLLFIIY